MDKMRAGRLVEAGKMVCEQVPLFEPEAGQVVVKNHMAAICGSDLHQVFMEPLGKPTYPAEPGWPGHEGVGEVIESRYEGLSVGDMVLTVPGYGFQRCFADVQTLPGHWCLPLPKCDGSIEDLLMAQQFGTTITPCGAAIWILSAKLSPYWDRVQRASFLPGRQNIWARRR